MVLKIAPQWPHTHECTNARMLTHTYTHKYACIHINMHACTHKHARTHAHTDKVYMKTVYLASIAASILNILYMAPRYGYVIHFYQMLLQSKLISYNIMQLLLIQNSSAYLLVPVILLSHSLWKTLCILWACLTGSEDLLCISHLLFCQCHISFKETLHCSLGSPCSILHLLLSAGVTCRTIIFCDKFLLILAV